MFIPGAPMSQEAIDRENRIDSIHAYYGIPILMFDGGDTQMEQDWRKASSLIYREKPIPEDLQKRLLSYKQNKEGNKLH